MVSVKEPAGSLTIAWQRGKPNPSSVSPPAPGSSPGSAAAVGVAAATTAEPALSPAAGGVDLSQMAAAQQECAETQDAAALTSLRIEFFPVEGKHLMCDVSLARPSPVVPVSLREAVFASIHSIAHPGIRATKRMVSARFVWRGMGADIARFCRDCQRCPRGKVTSTFYTQIQPIQLPVKRFLMST